jgi:type I restriction enzyme R subunit
MRQYRLKVERIIRDNANHITINKLRMNRQITKMDLEELERLLFTAEELGNRERFEKVFGHQQSLGAFIRKLVVLIAGRPAKSSASSCTTQPIRPPRSGSSIRW